MKTLKVATFEKVSFEQFKRDMLATFENKYFDEEIEEIYDHIKLPVRATTGSAGHDISTPISVELDPLERIMIPTGLRCNIKDNFVLFIFPRSSMGIKRGVVLSNTIPVIDSDYYNAANEGHIFLSIKNTSNKPLKIDAFENIVQAVFVPYGVADTEEVNGIRTGGIGSTSKK